MSSCAGSRTIVGRLSFVFTREEMATLFGELLQQGYWLVPDILMRPSQIVTYRTLDEVMAEYPHKDGYYIYHDSYFRGYPPLVEATVGAPGKYFFTTMSGAPSIQLQPAPRIVESRGAQYLREGQMKASNGDGLCEDHDSALAELRPRFRGIKSWVQERCVKSQRLPGGAVLLGKQASMEHRSQGLRFCCLVGTELFPADGS